VRLTATNRLAVASLGGGGGADCPGDTIQGGDAVIKVEIFLRLNFQEHRTNDYLQKGGESAGMVMMREKRSSVFEAKKADSDTISYRTG